MSVKLNPTSVIKARLGIDPNGKVQKFFTATCAKHIDKYVPFDKGDLADYNLGPDYIEYDQPYAEYQYYGMRQDGTHVIDPANRTRDKHPLATSYWDKHMVSAEMPDIIKEVQKFVDRR